MFDIVLQCYDRLRLITYRSMFRLLRERDGSLSATEAFSVDVIYLLHGPTVKQFADCLGISQPNATYKLNQLIQKGYVEKVPSTADRRELHLHVTDKYLCTFCNPSFPHPPRPLMESFPILTLRKVPNQLPPWFLSPVGCPSYLHHSQLPMFQHCNCRVLPTHFAKLFLTVRYCSHISEII